MTCGFANRLQATRVDSTVGSTAIAAGGLRAKERSSFETGVFGAIEFTGGIRSALWDKAKTQRLEFEMSFLKLSQLCSRR